MAKEVLKLKNPIKNYDGNTVSELEYDSDKISCKLFNEAATGTNVGEYYKFCLRLGMAAILAANEMMEWSDVERITGGDLMRVHKIGTNFIIASADAEEEN